MRTLFNLFSFIAFSFLVCCPLFSNDQKTANVAMVKSILDGRLEFFRSTSIYSPLPGAAFQSFPFYSYYATGMDSAICNGIMEDNGQRTPSEAEIDKAVEFFKSRNVPFIWWSSSKNLEEKGFQFGGILIGIALDISKGIRGAPPSSSDLTIKIAGNESDTRAFSELAVNAFGMNPSTLDQFAAINYATMKNGEAVHFMAYLKGKLVGTATLSTTETTSGVWNLGTLPEHRKIGVGGALVHAALVEAKKLNYPYVMAILMPKGMAWGLFTKLGFEDTSSFLFYVHGIAAEELEK